jgi:cell division protein FtsL
VSTTPRKVTRVSADAAPTGRLLGALRIVRPARTLPDDDLAPRSEEERGAPALRVVPRARRRRAGFLAALVCLTVFGIMLGLVAFQAKIAANQAQLDKVNAQMQDAQATYDRLRLAVAQLESPQAVIAAAKDKGMVVPAKVTYITPSMEDVLAVALAQGRSPAPVADPTSSDSTSGWAAVKPIVGGTP